jgi:hypothetical protein
MIHLAALLALGSPGADDQATAPAAQVQPAPDSAERRRALRDLVMCVADARPRWARETLSLPYLSEDQARLAANMLRGRDTCLLQGEVDMTFRTSTLIGSLAEHYIRTQANGNPVARATRALNTARPLNASEDFAMCVASRNPGAARELALSEPGSASEMRSAQQLAGHVAPCTNPNEQLTVDLQSLRALVATALYRGIAGS